MWKKQWENYYSTYLFSLFMQYYFLGEGHLAISHHGHTLSSIMGMLLGTDTPSHPRGSAYPREGMRQTQV